MPFYEHGPVRIHYEDRGSGTPILILPGGGLNSSMAVLKNTAPFNPMEEFGGVYRCITMDLRNSPNGQSSGPLEVDRPWDAFADDQLGLMDHLGIDKFIVMGFCIGGPLSWNLMRLAPERIAAAVLVQPSGGRPGPGNWFLETYRESWAPQFSARQSGVTPAEVDEFLLNLYTINPDFVFTVDREFVRQCETPVLIMPDDIPPHPYEVAMETAILAPNAEATFFPWKQPPELKRLALRHVRSFLKTHRAATLAG
jgi:pimeloyl-ACP methyl ester carboxylesterase